jgi:hypothetical protein
MINQFARGGLITLTHAHQAASHVERRFFIRHKERKLKPDTARKTGFTLAGYKAPNAKHPKNARLDSRVRRPIRLIHSNAHAFPGPSTYEHARSLMHRRAVDRALAC